MNISQSSNDDKYDFSSNLSGIYLIILERSKWCSELFADFKACTHSPCEFTF